MRSTRSRGRGSRRCVTGAACPADSDGSTAKVDGGSPSSFGCAHWSLTEVGRPAAEPVAALPDVMSEKAVPVLDALRTTGIASPDAYGVAVSRWRGESVVKAPELQLPTVLSGRTSN